MSYICVYNKTARDGKKIDIYFLSLLGLKINEP